MQKFVKKKQDNPGARVPIFATREGIRLEVFEESQLPLAEKPTFINFKSGN
jgi:hypothetical protein